MSVQVNLVEKRIEGLTVRSYNTRKTALYNIFLSCISFYFEDGDFSIYIYTWDSGWFLLFSGVRGRSLLTSVAFTRITVDVEIN